MDRVILEVINSQSSLSRSPQRPKSRAIVTTVASLTKSKGLILLVHLNKTEVSQMAIVVDEEMM